MNFFDWIVSWFHRDVSSIMKPLATAVRRVENFKARTARKVQAAKMYHEWGAAEIEKADRVSAKLNELIS